MFDAIATNKLGMNPEQFLRNNYCRARGQVFLTKTLACKGGAQYADKLLGGAQGAVAYGHQSLTITNSDLQEITDIGGRNTPTAFVGLFRVRENEYHAEVQDNSDAQHPLEVYFLPAAANQIVRINLPTAPLGPRLLMTDPISGCTVFVSDDGNGNRYMYHANSLAVAAGHNDAGRIYMRDLFRQFVVGSAQGPTHMFDRPFYEPSNTTWQTGLRLAKQNLGRDPNHISTGARSFNVFAIRTGAQWAMYYQMGASVSSVRTGLKAKLRGAQSDKFKVTLDPLPLVPGGGVPAP